MTKLSFYLTVFLIYGIVVDVLQASEAFIPALGTRKSLSPFLTAMSRTTSMISFMSNVEDDETTTKAKGDGALYDDQVAPYKPPISDTMRARLAREASSGLDPDAKQTNVLLYIMVAVVALVAFGGKDIFF